jgi:hypothetical protein
MSRAAFRHDGVRPVLYEQAVFEDLGQMVLGNIMIDERGM